MTRITVFLPVLTIALAVQADSYDMHRYTIDGGGATPSAGGAYEVSGTVGQPDAGILSGGDYALSGGFWFPVVDGDCNADGGINLFDFVDFESCMSGPGGGYPQPACACLDFDDDGDVDLHDYAGFQTGFTGD